MKFTRILGAALLVVSLLAALPAVVNRHRVEAPNRTVDLAIDLDAFISLAHSEGVPPAELLAQLKAAGITSAGVTERDSRALVRSAQVTVRQGQELKALALASGELSPVMETLLSQNLLEENHHYLFTEQRQQALELLELYGQRLPAEEFQLLAAPSGAPIVSNTYVIELKIGPELMGRLGHGFDANHFELLREAGLRPIPRPYNYPRADAAGVQATFERLAELAPETETVVFSGQQVLGNPGGLSETAAQLRERGWTLGLIEGPAQLGYWSQAGQEQLAEQLDYQIVRLFSYDIISTVKPHPTDLIDKWLRAAKERNIRILYLRPFTQPDPGETLIETNVKYFAALADELKASGFELGSAKPMAELHTPGWQLGLIGLGAVGAGLLWLGLLVPISPLVAVALAALGAAGSIGLALLRPTLAAQGLALATAAIFPAFALTLPLVRWFSRGKQSPQWLGDALWTLGTVWLISLGGGLLISGLMAESRFLLHFDYFRGVKVAFVIPLALVALSAWLLARRQLPDGLKLQSIVRSITKTLTQPVTYLYVLLGGLLLVFAFIYVARSGNQPGFGVSSLELKFRSFLEYTLNARPRNKEFLIGWPALLLAVVAAHKRLKGLILPLMVAAVTGAVSVVNSFSHSFTAVYFSALRSVHGLWFGLLVGLALAAVAAWAVDLVRKNLEAHLDG